MRLMTSEWLESVRRRALRKRVWFKVLNKLERGLVNLTIRCVNDVKSPRLALIIGRLVCKILKACRSRFVMRVMETGYDLAGEISRIAVSWGYDQASCWMRDKAFIRCLGVNAANDLL